MLEEETSDVICTVRIISDRLSSNEWGSYGLFLQQEKLGWRKKRLSVGSLGWKIPCDYPVALKSLNSYTRLMTP